MIAVTRRRLFLAARGLADKGALPPGAASADAYGRTRGGYFLAPETRRWPEVYHRQLAEIQAGAGAIAAAE
jgi:hypothetical protein